MELKYFIYLIVTTSNAVSEGFFPCKDCLPVSVSSAPGVGFGLSFSSGTVAAHLYNGTVLNLALINATQDYYELMARRVALPEASPLAKWNKWKRSLNKKFGKPATRDVGILAEMLISLREATASALNTTLDRVAISHPPIPGLAAYDLSDALEYASLRPWVAPDAELPWPEVLWPFLSAGMYIEELTEAHAVMGALGIGLCENYKNLFDCQKEQQFFPVEKVMVTGLSEADLRAEVIGARAPFDALENDRIERLVDLEAGLNACGTFDSDKIYWDHVGGRLRNLLDKLPAKVTLTRVMLVGENSTHPAFLERLRDALESSGYSQDRMLITKGEANDAIDPTFSSARGAAQYARWRQEAPMGCLEPIECLDETRAGHEKKIELK
ncbi:hypothetical protein NW762_011628 [Fusarium torreyae]|uniref:Uncharacterized protein n=1 Tax=Fusarium torreyae TaxID=1237075 RepID=A0A9W8VC91_9HYPO|nr:hypothetical protein NW762_011628 [Fusarium torreyae]